MKIYRIDEHHVLHRCPAGPELHVVDIDRTIVHVTDTGPCLTPVTIGHDTGATTTVTCGGYVPHDRQCDNCRTVVTTGRITASTRPDTANAATAPTAAVASGLAPQPCSVCGGPLAAVLADYGQHIDGRYISCHSRSRSTRPTRDAA